MPPAKSISFELLLDEGSKTRARIPLRVVLNTHDSTESIITTVKNFYGIYDGNGVSFEDAWGNTLIASYDNLGHNSTVYVRIVPAPQAASNPYTHGLHAGEGGYEPRRRPSLGEPFQMLPPHMREQSHSPSRPASRVARKRSISPSQGRGRRSASQQKGPSYASRGSSANGSYHEENGYSDSEAGRSSISGSKKARSEQFASSDISTANVLQDGRRGQPIFDSSTLPLFVPPQVPVTASQSSISPQRRSLPQEGPSPLHPPGQKIYGLQHVPILSPQSYGPSPNPFGVGDRSAGAEAVTPMPQHGHRLRDRSSMQQGHGRQGYTGNGILPTPDPTVASCISDEDVARTLIALGDASNYSHGRTSNSTMDETFSGVADAASSTGATSDSDEYSDAEGGLPKHRKYLDDEDEEYAQDSTKGDQEDYEGLPKTKKIKTKMHDGPSNGYRPKTTPSMKHGKFSKVRPNSLPKIAKHPTQPGLMKAPSAPASAGQVRKSSSSSLNFQHQLAADEEDLSSKPRCQRCRKSKKGCDRQRPCGRCKDAGIGIEGCISEDEGNGRKGRYGRHMGVPVKKVAEGLLPEQSDFVMAAPNMLADSIGIQGSPDKNKKRKR
ncbi:uncharacterized protein A1O5_01739 [Cladophialophora psammophila CBS 110553]|uniref:Zn(2)-C6 fungal-type domain-containing protein n=1 Tax=Cladophialophora psammophila CBS 110553 TaxID=1182543 RepID=W9X4C5_9EURO|nr:uncharacterized protein A1O5_01739 [Cladophialophora psammophila CBS 110553]EXJ75043.1 hypothetical protein A1O5_01739 [Cladophialophora psammophila CBS 110553]